MIHTMIHNGMGWRFFLSFLSFPRRDFFQTSCFLPCSTRLPYVLQERMGVKHRCERVDGSWWVRFHVILNVFLESAIVNLQVWLARFTLEVMHVVWVCLGVVRDRSESREVSWSTKYQKRIQRGSHWNNKLMYSRNMFLKQAACIIYVALRLKEQWINTAVQTKTFLNSHGIDVVFRKSDK